MQTLRALIRNDRHLALLFILLAFCMKVLIPAGFMVSASKDTVLTVTFCSDGTSGAQRMQLVIPGDDQGSDHNDSGQKGEQCTFSGLAKVAVGGADAILLAAAFACIMAVGIAPAQRPPFRQAPYLRPPLRGPPTVSDIIA